MQWVVFEVDGFDRQEGRKLVKADEEDVVGKQGRKSIHLVPSFMCLMECMARVWHETGLGLFQ